MLKCKLTMKEEVSFIGSGDTERLNFNVSEPSGVGRQRRKSSTSANSYRLFLRFGSRGLQTWVDIPCLSPLRYSLVIYE